MNSALATGISASEQPLVSVAMVAYNHERFIDQAIQSVLNQERTFPIELVIGEDCSTDRTREIVLESARQHPGLIRPILHRHNLGMMRNFQSTLQACRGRYIALLEADDYWISRSKLQRQFEFMERQPQFSGCFTLTEKVTQTGEKLPTTIPGSTNPKAVYTTADLLQKNWMATCSFFFRNVIQKLDFAPLLSLKMIDWPLQILISRFGPVGYLPERMAAYRIHLGGVWTSAPIVPKLEAAIAMYKVLRALFGLEHRTVISGSIAKTYQKLAAYYLGRKQRRSAFAYAIKSVGCIPLSETLALKTYLKQALLLVGTCTLVHGNRLEQCLRR